MFALVKAAELHLPVACAIITTTSIQAYNPIPHLVDYAASKSVIASFTIRLPKQFAKKDIRTNGVAPVPLWMLLQLDYGQLEGALSEFGQKPLFGRSGEMVELGA